MKRKPKPETEPTTDLNVRVPRSMKGQILVEVLKRREQTPYFTMSDFVREKLSEVLPKS